MKHLQNNNLNKTIEITKIIMEQLINGIMQMKFNLMIFTLKQQNIINYMNNYRQSLNKQDFETSEYI